MSVEFRLSETRLSEKHMKLYAEPIAKSQQGWTFSQIKAKYGEEAAIHAGIATDPDAAPLQETVDKARPLAEVDTDLYIAE